MPCAEIGSLAKAEKLAGKLLAAIAEMTPASTNHHHPLIDIRRVTSIPITDWSKSLAAHQKEREE